MILSYVSISPLLPSRSNQFLELEPILENINRNQPGHLCAHQRRDELVHCTSHSNLHGRMGQSLSQVALLVCFFSQSI